MSEVKWHERILRRASFMQREEALPADGIAVDGDGQEFGYEVNWTRMLVEDSGPHEVTWRTDIAATKVTARILCQHFSSTSCQCSEDPLHCGALAYVTPALKIVQALRKSDLFRYCVAENGSEWNRGAAATVPRK